MSGDFGAIFSGVQSALSDDPNAKLLKAGDIHLASRAPYGILTGIPELDFSLGRPGLPAGKVSEFFGFEASGKTTAALHVIGQAQRKGGGGLYIDAEQSWDEDKARICGVDPDVNFAIADVDTIEGIFRILEATCINLAETGWNKPFVAVVDSITAVQSQRGKATEIGAEPRVGEDARVIRHGMRKLVSEFGKVNMTPIFINHAISNIASSPFAKQSTSSGGHIIKFMSSVRLQFSAGSNLTKQVKGQKERVGMKSFIKIEKLKGSPLMHPVVECPLLNNCGFDTNGSLLEAMVQTGMVEKKNAKIYSIVTDQDPIEFSGKEWPTIVHDLGGTNAMYDNWIDYCIKEGKMQHWSSV